MEAVVCDALAVLPTWVATRREVRALTRSCAPDATNQGPRLARGVGALSSKDTEKTVPGLRQGARRNLPCNRDPCLGPTSGPCWGTLPLYLHRPWAISGALKCVCHHPRPIPRPAHQRIITARSTKGVNITFLLRCWWK